MLRDETASATFSAFVEEREQSLRTALTARFGIELGREAAAEALGYAWEHWERVRVMESPVGFLYAVGRDRARRMARRRPVVFPVIQSDRAPWVEPGLSQALARLSSRQRTVVVLLYCFEWTQREVAEVLGISKSSVQRHAERGLASLRKRLGVGR